LASSPVHFRRIFFIKLIFFSFIFIAISFFIGIINTSILHDQLSISLVFLLLLATAVFFVTTFGLSLAALFPSFETDDPELISTSLPGLIFMVSSLGYGGICAWVFHDYLLNSFPSFIVIFISSSLICIYLLSYYASRSLEKIEFASKQI
jgi:hypothetical protein